MREDTQPSGRSSTAQLVATAAVTLAVGVTVASFTGYLRPPQMESSARADSPVDAAAAASAQQPGVVLVPVSRDAPSPQPPESGRVLLASYQEGLRDEGKERRDGDRGEGPDEDSDEDSDRDTDRDSDRDDEDEGKRGHRERPRDHEGDDDEHDEQ